ncbi:protein DpdE [Aeromonas media]|uniref:protein DpdE n=1 Tax=Aeromonas media TaxID=651 RepID=UPI0038CFEB2D
MLTIGSLVRSESFYGVGKVVSTDFDKYSATVAFFESPANPYARQIEINVDTLVVTALHEETVIYCQHPQNTRWTRARFGGARPNGDFLVIFRDDEHATIPINHIHVLNKNPIEPLNPAHFLAYQANDAPFFFPRRQDFIDSYIQQRAACLGIASLSSSAVELEPHQLAVVKRVLQDDIPKYILADEVGLGKTIEAGMIIREHALEKEGHASMLVAVPSSLVEQWTKELGERFQLKQIITSVTAAFESIIKNKCAEGIVICSYDEACFLLDKGFKPSLVTIDEVHQIASWPWSDDTDEVSNFHLISDACKFSTYVLLLTGTPLHGHERNFLSMLHCINPDAYQVDETHLLAFTELVKNRESLGGVFSALVPSVSNISLRRNLDELLALFPDDCDLSLLCQNLFPLIGRFTPPSPEREAGIRSIRLHLGERYRIHHRLLRNRRQVSLSQDESKNLNLDLLFPGLNGVLECHWHTEGLTLDELLEEYRALASLPQNKHWLLKEANYITWIDDLFSSPLCVMQHAKALLTSSSPTPDEQALLDHIVATAKNELRVIDNTLVTALNDWLQKFPEGKAIVFCDRPELAQHLLVKLSIMLDHPIECYQPGQPLQFTQQQNPVRVLLCDKSGEDGLNLHGGRRLAVHYGLPRSCSRIEQRLGRLNRYSANLRGIKPIQSLILKNNATHGLRNRWAEILVQSIGVFNNTIASLQFVLDEYIGGAWGRLYQEGPQVLENLAAELPGEHGVLTREANKINMQEKLLAMDEEVAQAALFAQRLSNEDLLAVEQCKALTPWITQGLRFRHVGNAEEGMRFRFELGERNSGTLVDFKTFLTTCMLSFDKDGGNPPSTYLMSAGRIPAINGTTVYPLRYGQPFVDSIWSLLNQDARGSSMAILRVVPASLNEPRYFFQLSWLVTHCNPLSDYAQIRKGDENHPPYILQEWLTIDGTVVTNSQIIELLNKEYSNNESPQKNYVDLNLRPSLWQEIEELVSPDNWKEMVERVYGKSLEKLREQTGSESFLQLMAMKSVIVCSRNILAGVA